MPSAVIAAVERQGVHWLARRQLVAFVARRATQGRLVVLVYHHVSAAEGHLFAGLDITVTPEEFGRQMRVLASRYRVVSLKQWLRDGRPPESRERTVVVTFDDGYRSVLTEALPYLAAEHIPATVFVCPAFIGNDRVPLLFVIRVATKELGARRVERLGARVLGGPQLGVPDLEARVANTFSRDLDQRLKRELLDALGVGEQALARELGLFLTWDDVRLLARSGIDIGNHSHSHQVLSRLSRNEQQQEVLEAKAAIRSELHIHDVPFAFPYGRPRHFDPETVAIVAASRHTCALAVGGDNAPGTSPYALRRTLVTRELPFVTNVEVMPALERLRGAIVRLVRGTRGDG